MFCKLKKRTAYYARINFLIDTNHQTKTKGDIFTWLLFSQLQDLQITTPFSSISPLQILSTFHHELCWSIMDFMKVFDQTVREMSASNPLFSSLS